MEPLFVAFTCQASQRSAVIAEELGSVWLYLSRRNESAPERDCWLLNTEAQPPRDREYYRQHKSPPPAPPGLVLAGGTTPAPSSDRWTVQWSADGESVAALLDGMPVGLIVSGHQRGYARYIADDARPWAFPWSDDAFGEAFSGSLK
jgi:hypothetical protein